MTTDTTLHLLYTYSEHSPSFFPYTAETIFHRCFSYLSNPMKIFLALLLILIILIPLIFVLYFPRPPTDQFLSAHQIIALQPTRSWCGGVTASEHVDESSDGLSLSAFSVNKSAIQTKHVSIPSSTGRYPITNMSIKYSEVVLYTI